MASLRADLQGHPLSDAGPTGSAAAPGPGLYVHVPFCRVRCPYCDFATTPWRERTAERYLEAALREAEALAPALGGRRFETVHFGGGTPSRLGAEAFARLAAGLARRLPLDGAHEVTLEANPEDLDRERVDAWSAAGVTRVSIGVQSFDDIELARLGRVHDAARAARGAALVAERFATWSLDLLYGFPGQTPAGARASLERAVGLGAPHLSLYHCTAEPGTPLGDAVRAGRVRMAGEDEAAVRFDEAAERLGRAGYEHYEISNHARPGHRSRHNGNLWRGGDYLGLGPSAVSTWGRRRWRNEPEVEAWCEAALAGRPRTIEHESIGERAGLETAMLGLRLLEGVPWTAFPEGDGSRARWRAAAGRLAAEGWLVVDAAGMRVPRERRRLTDAVVLRLWEAAESEAGASLTAARGGGCNGFESPPAPAV